MRQAVAPTIMPLPGTQFESELEVRPTDIDMFQHVHNSHYLDYVLAARYEQMGRCYGMTMEAFMERGYGWVVRTAHVEYKRPLGLGDRFLVRTWVEEIEKSNVRVGFQIARKDNGKLSCDGWFLYTLVGLTSGKAEAIPQDIIERYSI